jgi:hypothetical protein
MMPRIVAVDMASPNQDAPFSIFHERFVRSIRRVSVAQPDASLIAFPTGSRHAGLLTGCGLGPRSSENAQHSLKTHHASPSHHRGEVIMKRAPTTIVVAACAMTLGAGGCAHASRPVILEPPAGASVSRLSDLPSMPGAHVVVLLRSGESASGTVERIHGNVLVLRVTEDSSTTRRVSEEEIVCLARRVGKSTKARGWLGALIGATVSLPFGISMVGDMMMPAAIVGALIAGNTGQPRARVLLDRSHSGASESVCPTSLRASPD